MVPVIVAFDDDQIAAQFLRFCDRHGAVDTEGSCFIAGSRYDTAPGMAADDERLALQRRIQQHFRIGKESIQVDMKDHPCHQELFLRNNSSAAFSEESVISPLAMSASCSMRSFSSSSWTFVRVLSPSDDFDTR